MSTLDSAPRARKRPQDRSGEIHDVAVELARESGLSALTLRAIAGRAGVAPGLVAHYCGSMEQLVARTFRTVVRSELEEIEAELHTEEFAAPQLAHLVEMVLRSDHHAITQVWIDAWSLGRHSAVLADAIQEEMAAWQGCIAGIIVRGHAAGSFSVEDPDTVAWQMLAMIDGIAAHALTRGTDAGLFGERLVQAYEVLVGAPAGSVQVHLR